MRKYEQYKDSGVEWAGEIPSNWTVSKLKYVADLQVSGVDKKTNEGEMPIRLCNYLDVYKNEFITSEIEFMKASATAAEIEKYLLRKNDVLATKDSEDPNDIAVPALVMESFDDVICAYHLVQIRADSISLFGPYLYYLFCSNPLRQYFSTEASGVTRFGLGTGAFNDLTIPLPKSAEQRNIAAHLDAACLAIQKCISKKEQLTTLLIEEKAALINHAVTKGIDDTVPMKPSGIEWLGEMPVHWKVKKFKYMIKSIAGGGTPSTDKPEYWNGEIPWVSPKDMKVERNIKETEDYVTDKAIENSSTGMIPPGRVLLVVRSGILKHTLPIAVNVVPVTLNQDMKAIEPNELIEPEFLFWLLKGHSQSILTFCKKLGATVDSIETDYLRGFPIPFPNPDEQKTIVSHIESQMKKFEQTISKIEKEIELLAEYKASLIYEVVTGKVKVDAEVEELMMTM